ncbi:MAG: TIGR02757 family protein [Ignavibacteriaceae bacterium]|nr:TIGR02757 family protein [Ignavibacteriaceae bacterium]
MNLKQQLEYHYKEFDKNQIAPDPLEFLHLYRQPLDIEAMGVIAAVFAYGNVKQINNTLEKIRIAADNKPYQFVYNFDKSSARKLNGIMHRFYTNDDIIQFFFTLKYIYREYGSLKNFFYQFYDASAENLKSTISSFSTGFYDVMKNVAIKKNISPGIKFMFPLPELGSACKRTNLFLRWMIRKDELDFGLWDKIPASKLIIPVDTHVARVCAFLKLTERKNPGWKMAEEITNKLKKFDADDPVKYDFAICHIGMRKIKF